MIHWYHKLLSEYKKDFPKFGNTAGRAWKNSMSFQCHAAATYLTEGLSVTYALLTGPSELFNYWGKWTLFDYLLLTKGLTAFCLTVHGFSCFMGHWPIFVSNLFCSKLPFQMPVNDQSLKMFCEPALPSYNFLINTFSFWYCFILYLYGFIFNFWKVYLR